MLSSNDNSVYSLISELCENLLQLSGSHKIPNDIVIKKLKSVSYEVLLKKSPKSLSISDSVCDPLRELNIKLFELSICAKNDYIKDSKCNEFKKCLKVFSEEGYFNEDIGKSILIFLITLQESAENAEEQHHQDILQQSILHMPKPFTLYSDQTFQQFESRSFEGFGQIKPLQDNKNPYLPRFLFRSETSELLKINKKFGILHESSANIFNTVLQNIKESSLNTVVPSAFKLLPGIPLGTSNGITIQPACEKNIKEVKAIENKIHKEFSESLIENKIVSWNWERLGDCEITRPPHFATESNGALYFNNLLSQNSGKIYSAKIVPCKHFINDLKALTIGIQSDTFQYDNYIIFHMLPGITINGVSPIIIESFVSKFLECGTCYKRLQIMIAKRNYKLMYDGFIFKALCSAIEDFLLLFRQIVTSLECTRLIDLHYRLQDMMKQIVGLSRILAIHPNADTNFKPPMDSQFLVYLYKEISQVTQKDTVMLLVYILKRCCNVYFKHLQKWLFYGILDDPFNELFIGFIDHYRPCTKYFFDKACFVRKESVPGFFNGYENKILQCGKYAMLLKAFKPNHPLFDLEHPLISVALSYEEIEKIIINSKKYFEKSREICGKPITVRDIFDKKMERKKEFFKKVLDRSKKNMEKWAAEQKEKATLLVAEKRKRLEEIHTQLEAARERKIAERKANIQLELKLLRENEQMENARLIQENLELQKTIEYHQELNLIMDKRRKRLELMCIENTTVDEVNSKTSPTEDTLLHVSPPTFSTETEIYSSEENHESKESILNKNIDQFKENGLQLVEREQNPVSFEKEQNNEDNVKIPTQNESNDLNENLNVMSELQQNRKKILSSSIDNCFNETNSNTQDKITDKISSTLTEAQKIKIKILMQEFGYHLCDNAPSGVTDVNSNPTALITNESSIHQVQNSGTLSDLARNRQQMMQNKLFEDNNSECDRKKLNLDLNTERSRNRRKVLESEFNILTGQSNSEHATPMSITSDSPLIDKIEEIEMSNIDTKNIPKLTIDIEMATNIDIENMGLDMPTAMVEETPEYALNTAGIVAKKGFDFIDSGRKSEQSNIKPPLPSSNCSDVNLQLEINDNIPNTFQKIIYSPYKRCVELLETNFKCEPVTPFIALKKPQKLSKGNEERHILENKRKQLNCLNSITLTEFLQKSFTIPLNVHMEIINNEIMRIFLDDLDIIGHFKSLRNYFFLMDGEFGSYICDGLITKLERGASPNELLNYQMLHTILENALSSSIMGNDKNAENLSFIVAEFPEKFDLNSPSVLDNLSLSYRVVWPVNLILSPETLKQYANIFRYLMKVRRISWILEESYQMLKEIVKKYGNKILQSPQYRKVQQIRHKFFHFVHALRNHITSNALQASWKIFKDDLISAKTIEDIYRKHATYIKNILFFCMLNKKSEKFYNTVEDIFKVSLKFYRDLKAREWKKLPGNEFYTHSRYEKLVGYETEFDKLIKYTIYLGNKIVLRGYQEEIGELINLINYNYYYVSAVDTEV